MAESTREHWDRFWIDHEAIDDVYSNEDRVVNELARLEPSGKIIVEIGAGSGRDSLEMARRGARVVILDYSRPSLATARTLARRFGLDVHFVCGDAIRSPIAGGSVDVVFHQGLLEHFRDPLPLLVENARIVAPGGHVLVDVPQTFHAYTLLKKALIAVDRWFAGWETQFTRRELEGLVRRAGLEVRWSYGAWFVPGLFYRALRAALRRLGIVLPKYPKIEPVHSIGRLIRSRLDGTRFAFYSYAMIGTVGRRPARPEAS